MNKQKLTRNKSTSFKKPKTSYQSYHNFINYEQYLSDDKDTFDSLINKNEGLSLLLVEANRKLNELVKEKESIENDSKIEKKSILQQLEKISENYRTYANSHKTLKYTEKKMNNIIQLYSGVNEELSRYKQLLNDVINNYYETYENIDTILKKKDLNSILSNLTHLRNGMYESSNKMCVDSNIISLRKGNNSKLNSNTNRKSYSSILKKRMNNTIRSKSVDNKKLNDDIYSE